MSDPSSPSLIFIDSTADHQGSNADLVDDGLCVRKVWRPEHGNGDSTPHVIQRVKGTIKGHPTWKVYTSDVPHPILRGSRQEPPHYVYLEDRACYAIWKSMLYTYKELRTFWPFDFDHQGNIKAGRKNRGRPAWSDESETAYAKANLRAKGKYYEFTGAPAVTDYKPKRPRVKTRMELQVEAEYAARFPVDPEDTSVITTMDKATKETPASGTPAKVMYPAGTSITNSNELYPARPFAKHTELTTRTPAPKRKFIGPFEVSPTDSSPDSPTYKRVKLGSRKDPLLMRPSMPSTDLNADGGSSSTVEDEVWGGAEDEDETGDDTWLASLAK
ncbi:hypothetical protein N0V90_007252 [Kalmusia sp. IMI 367209]|nr:hypothetical protein N0V90_007252 [Kalmusia sp. IMI 367209]